MNYKQYARKIAIWIDRSKLRDRMPFEKRFAAEFAWTGAQTPAALKSDGG
jgi:hypothetical protein